MRRPVEITAPIPSANEIMKQLRFSAERAFKLRRILSEQDSLAAPPSDDASLSREVLRCDHCKLVQFRTDSATCKRCKMSLDFEERLPEVVAVTKETSNVIQMGAVVRRLRQRCRLSQQQLAARMNVPRTYIEKVENDVALPTLPSLDRLAKALEVNVMSLFRDADKRQSDDSVAGADEFLTEMAAYASQLDSLQRSVLLQHLREIASYEMDKRA